MSQVMAAVLTILLGLIYLIVRAVRIRGGYLLPVVWCLAFVASGTALIVVWPASDESWLPEDVESVLVDYYSPILNSDVDATCPAVALTEPGDWYECTMTTDTGEMAVEVTLNDDDTVSFLLLRSGA